MSVLERVMVAGRAALGGWNSYGSDPGGWPDDSTDRYALLWAWYQGRWRNDQTMWRQRVYDPAIYKNTRQLWRQASAIVNLYEQFVYQGDLSTDGKPLPDGSRGAIPIDPQTGEKATDKALVTACHELFSIWHYQQYMSIRPKIAAILGDCLTEIVDDYQHGSIYTSTIWPGYVPDADLVLDDMGNVKQYAIEYMVDRPATDTFGRPQKEEHYKYRKEVDTREFRYYKDGKPWADVRGHGDAVQRNPYGFCPAIWDRHDMVPWRNRGISSLERTLRQTMELNSVLSHAMDYQRKQFSAPIGVKGGGAAVKGGRVIPLPGGISVTFPSNASPDPDDLVAARSAAAEQLNLLPMGDTGEFVTVNFNVGQTASMLQLVMDSILAETPEARYGQEILKMSQVTGPGMERVLAPIVGLIKQARKMHDVQTTKLLQMSIAILGFRLNNGDIPRALISARQKRYDVFKPFNLDSFGKGLLDLSIPGRDVFPETPLEKAQRLTYVQQLESPYLLVQAGVPEEIVLAEQADKKAAADLMAKQFAPTPPTPEAPPEGQPVQNPPTNGRVPAGAVA